MSSDCHHTDGSTTRLRTIIHGAVQGVGFRPFLFKLAEELGLKGWVNNSAQGVAIEAEGPHSLLESFLVRLETEKPPRSFIQSLESSWLDPVGYNRFEIRESDSGGAKTTLVLPDIATCPDCLREIFDSSNRRYRYAFTNCTNCGPRFSIIESLPYDRGNTSMRKFTMCPQCQAEYENPRDRRFHAQPNACPVCGPHLELWDADGVHLLAGAARSADANLEALHRAAEAIRAGQVLALKGLGGFHLMVAAGDERAVLRLRERKHREEKPLALMFPSLETARAVCEVSPLEERLLKSPEAPIVLLRRRGSAPNPAAIAPSIAPGNPNLGVMLPYTPLHHLLLSFLDFPVVATSGNLSDEPICIDEHDALARLRGIADLFLVHNRPIVRHVDDSIARVMAGRELVVRRARGFAPLPVQVRCGATQQLSVLGVGAHLKNTVALSVGPQVFVSQHIGDLETEPAYDAFRHVITDFEKLYESKPVEIAADAHPDYLSTTYARELCDSTGVTTKDKPSRLIQVQHHLAHVLSCMAENELAPPVLGVSWDGTGYGLDGTIWGGEFFLVTAAGAERVAHLRQFRLPGGDKAVKEPRRTALGLLFELYGDEAFAMAHLAPVAAFSTAGVASLRTMLRRGVNAPLTSSVGRLFDAVASIAGVRQQVRFEGQAAMELEFALNEPGPEKLPEASQGYYPIELVRSPESRVQSPESKVQSPKSKVHCRQGVKSGLVMDWAPLVRAVITDVQEGITRRDISARFHHALVKAILEVARSVGENHVVLTGGCFQNRYLTETAVRRLSEAGFRPYWHQRVPPNDGGIALGQVMAALCQTSLG